MKCRRPTAARSTTSIRRSNRYWILGSAVIGITGASMDVTEFREASEALREAKRKLTEEKLYLEQEIDTELGFGDIIGQSKALQVVMEHVGKWQQAMPRCCCWAKQEREKNWWPGQSTV